MDCRRWRGMDVASRDDIERVREATDLVALIGEHVPLQPRGREHVGLCPFHDDRRPSFAVVTHKAAAFYKCHACGAAGDCFRFVQEHLGKDFGEALRFLAERASIELTGADVGDDGDQRRARRTWLRKAMAAADAHFRSNLTDEKIGADARKAIADRGISDEMVERFGLGAAGDGWSTLKDAIAGDEMPAKVLLAAGLLKQRDDGHAWDAFRHRLMFPIMDETGQPIAFGGRILGEDESPKYLNSAEHDLFHKSRTLFGLHLARRAIMSNGRAIVTEGYTDVIACHQAGIEHVIGTLGTALTSEHARHLSRLCDVVILLFDGDEAGQRAAVRTVPIMLEHAVDVRICTLPGGCDPDDLLRQEDGVAQFHSAIESSVDGLEFLLDRLAQEAGAAEGLAGRQRVLETFMRTVASDGLRSLPTLRRAMVVGRLADLAGVAPAVISEMLDRTSPTPSTPTPQDAPESLLPDITDMEAANPALKRAELDVLSLAIYTQQAQVVPTPADCEAMITPSARRIGMALQNARSDAETASIECLLSALSHEQDRTLASDLFFDGERLLDAADGDVDAAHELCQTALQRCRRELESRRRMTDWKASPTQDAQAAAEMIDQLRGMGPRAAAMPRTSGS